MTRPKTLSELHKEALDALNEKCPPDEMIKQPSSNHSSLGDYMSETDALKQKPPND
jgi:hypothetical protein